MRIVLASASTRRRQVLFDLGLDVVSVPTNAKELRPLGTVDAQVLSIAKAKAAAVADAHEGSVVVVADTMLADPDDARQGLGQPVDAAEALAMLHRLRGRRHRVWSAAGLRVSGTWAFHVESAVVELNPFSDEVLAELIDSGSWRGKAGGYDLEGAMGPYARVVDGAPSTVLGLPEVTLRALEGLAS
jgi:septum formation protein